MRDMGTQVMLALVMFAGMALMSSAVALASNLREPERLEIEIGEPIGDVMARSTRKYDFPIELDMQSLSLLLGQQGGRPLQIVLRNGAGQSAVLPYEPFEGELWMHVGVTDELDLRFIQFPPLTAVDRADAQSPATQDEAAIEGITAIYTRILPLTVRPRGQINCYRNSLEISRQPCDGVTLATERLSPEALRERLRAFHVQAANEARDGSKPARSLNLGQWWLPNGGLVMLTVTAEADAREDPIRLSLTVNISDYFHSSLSRLILACYDQQALFPEKMRYSQAQAAQIFHGLYADFFPPVVDGEVVTDRIALAELDWTQLSDSYWNTPSVRSGFCSRLRELEIDAGYKGPFAPLR